MPLLSPTYLDYETLIDQAQYAGVDVPIAGEVIERNVRKGSLEASASLGMFQASGGKVRDVEYQKSYSMATSNKAVFSGVIDELTRGGQLTQAAPGIPVFKDQLLEVSGISRLAPASMVGKMLHLLLRTINASTHSIDDLNFDQLAPEMMEHFKAIYFGNELLPIPLLLEATDTSLESRVFISLSPNHFVDSAGIDRVEGDITVLGTVSSIVAESKAITTERWLLDGYEWLLRRVMMTKIDDVIDQVVAAFDVGFLPAEARHVIEGPAIVLEAIAVY